jgi:protein phosphatase-4 regulatory subunit 3
MEALQRNRVKVYQLNDSGGWDDKGTGYVHAELIEERPGFRVYSEADHSPLLNISPASSSEVFHRQGDTIISWTDPETNIDLALSFAEASSAQELWERLVEHQGEHVLPPAELGKVPEIAQMLGELAPVSRERSATELLANDGAYLKKLFQVFHTCEDLEDDVNLSHLFKIFRTVVLLNDTQIYELVLGDEMIDDFLGVMEYDPDVGTSRILHREFMRDQAKFKQVVEIEDKTIQTKIHQNFRISYLKDVILPRALDDAAFSTLNSIMFFNNIEIVNHLQSDREFLQTLFAKIRLPENQEHRRDLYRFLQELCNRAKELQMPHRTSFYKALCKHGFFSIFDKVLTDVDQAIRIGSTDILTCSLNHDASLLRHFILTQSAEDYPLLTCLVDRLLHERDSGMKAQLKDILQMLLDPEVQEVARDKSEQYDTDREKNEFLYLFYDKFFDKLIQPFMLDTRVPNGIAATQADPTGDEDCRIFICELLCFCVAQHGYRIKHYIFRHNIVSKILLLLKQKHKYLVLGAIRFLRACVGLKDDFYNRYIIKNHLFEPVMKVFAENGSRYNMTNSAIIEMFDFIVKEGNNALMEYVVDKFRSQIELVTYVDTFKAMLSKHEQHKEFVENQDACGTKGAEARWHAEQVARRRVIEDDDEAYFNSSDGEEDSDKQAALKLVDYTSDGDEDTSSSNSDQAERSAKRSSNCVLGNHEGGKKRRQEQ